MSVCSCRRMSVRSGRRERRFECRLVRVVVLVDSSLVRERGDGLVEAVAWFEASVVGQGDRQQQQCWGRCQGRCRGSCRATVRSVAFQDAMRLLSLVVGVVVGGWCRGYRQESRTVRLSGSEVLVLLRI